MERDVPLHDALFTRKDCRMVLPRLAVEADVPFIHTMIVKAIMMEMPQYSKAAKSAEVDNITFSQIRESIDNHLCVVVGDPYDIAGVCMGEPDAGPIWLSWIVVRPEDRKKGHGEDLIRRFLHQASVLGHKVTCSSVVGNEGSEALLEKCGFSKMATLLDHWHRLDFNLWERIGI